MDDDLSLACLLIWLAAGHVLQVCAIELHILTLQRSTASPWLDVDSLLRKIIRSSFAAEIFKWVERKRPNSIPSLAQQNIAIYIAHASFGAPILGWFNENYGVVGVLRFLEYNPHVISFIQSSQASAVRHFHYQMIATTIFSVFEPLTSRSPPCEFLPGVIPQITKTINLIVMHIAMLIKHSCKQLTTWFAKQGCCCPPTFHSCSWKTSRVVKHDEDRCLLCLEPLTRGAIVPRNPCGHSLFHAQCLLSWFMCELSEKRCPMPWCHRKLKIKRILPLVQRERQEASEDRDQEPARRAAVVDA